MISDAINLLHHFSYVLTLLLQDGLNAFPLVGAESNGGLLRTQYLFHLSLLIVFFHSIPFDSIAQMTKLMSIAIILSSCLSHCQRELGAETENCEVLFSFCS